MRFALVAIVAGTLLAGEDTGETRFSLSVANEASAPVGGQVEMARASDLLLIQPSFSYRDGQRWRVVTSFAAIGSAGDTESARLRVKEAWAGVTLGDFDLTAGKKILKWGTGYAFTPTGVLDPARDPSDPTDRLGLNQGREMVAGDWIHGRHAITAAFATAGLVERHRAGMRETAALRYNTLAEGFDTALVYAHDRGRSDFFGANFTRVFGDALELHGELAHRDRTAVLVGGKYMFPGGVSTIAEFYSPEAPRKGRYVYASVGKSRLRELPGWKHWDVSVALLANTTDRSRIGILDVTRRLGDRVSLTLRAETPGGKRWRSEYGMIPYSALLSIGFRYQI
jgi:hypothetical protein